MLDNNDLANALDLIDECFYALRSDLADVTGLPALWDALIRLKEMTAAMRALSNDLPEPSDDELLEAWAAEGIAKGYAVRSGHPAWDGKTWVPTLVLQTSAVKALGAKDA